MLRPLREAITERNNLFLGPGVAFNHRGRPARGSRRASQHRAFRWLGGRLSLRPQYDRCLIRADLTVGHRAGIDLLLSLRRAAVAIR